MTCGAWQQQTCKGASVGKQDCHEWVDWWTEFVIVIQGQRHRLEPWHGQSKTIRSKNWSVVVC